MAATVLHPSLDGLVHPEARARRDAIASLAVGPLENRYALRHVLCFDEDAEVRVLAARRLGELRDPVTFGWLLEALEDRLASVRHAVWNALARFGAAAVLEAAERALGEEEVWWVRRAAVRAAVAARGEGGLGLLLVAFDDPFWRVRHAAAQAVALLGEESEAVRARVRAAVSKAPSAQSALAWLEHGWGGALPVLTAPSLSVAGFDDDPAVTTARLERERGAGLTTAELVQLLGDPHEALRQVARRVLIERADPQTGWLALLWLDEVRVPQAAAEARMLLGRLGGDDAALAARVLAETTPRPGPLRWAAELADASSCRTHFASADPKVRAAVARAIDFEQVVADPSPRVRREAVDRWHLGALGTRQRAAWAKAVVDAASRLELPVERRMLAEAAVIARDTALLVVLARDPDPRTRATAVAAVRTPGAELDADPWVRAAAVDAQTAPALLASDPDPWVRRAALERLVTDGQLTPQVRLLSAQRAAVSHDGPIRTRAAGLFTPPVCALPGALELALTLSLDERLDVRAAIASVLEKWPDLDGALDALLASGTTDEVRISALSWRLRNADRGALAVLEAQAGRSQSARVNDHLDALTLVFPDEWISGALEDRKPTRRPRVTQPRRPLPAVVPLPSWRALGKSGLQVSPLVVSGVHGLEPAAFENATRAGVNTFFWEREYQGLTRFLRVDAARRESLVIIGGTYHSGPAAIRRDVENALKALRTDRLEVFLLFWVRSAQRLDDDNFGELQRLGEEGKLRTFGFSTHLREIATAALEKQPWPVVMTRYNAAHPGAAASLFPAARRHGTGILAFSATCYGRLLEDASMSAADCYGYCLHDSAVSAVVSAPRNFRELEQNLAVLTQAPFSLERMQQLAAHGAVVHERSKSFNALIRQAPGRSREVFLKLLEEGAS